MAKKPDEPKISGKGKLPLGVDNPTLNSPGYASTAPISGEERTAATEGSSPRLSDDEVVGGRYRIVRYIARGGMGEVYEAEDLELGERVALKTIRAETKDRVAEERFKREIQLSRKVTHPNVCRIFDVGYHIREDGERVVFLTMEMLLGETLIDRIRREGPLTIPAAAALLRQISAGLSAAHAVGVVHRDLKSSNVILVPRKGGGMRAVVTDFGLAHVVGGGEDRARSLSGSGGIVGTPGYMAPEQVEGGELSGRTDVYALGVVMYEMLTSKLPFEGTTPLSIAAKRLTMVAPSPKKLRPELPPRWEKAVIACLERDPAARPATPRAVAEMVGLITDSLEEIDGTIRIEKEPRRFPVVLAALGLLLIVLAVVSVQRWRQRPHGPSRRAIAAVPFHPADDTAMKQLWMGAFAAELTAVRLGESQALQIFDSASVTASLHDIGAAAGAELQATEFDRLCNLLTLDLVVTGRYRITDAGVLVVDAQLRDARTRGSIADVSESGSVEEVVAVLGRVADRLGRAAGVTSGEQGHGLSVTLPKRPVALRAFVEGRDLYDRDEHIEATAAAKRGITEEPDCARLHLLLAEAYASSGNERGATAEAKIVVQLAPNLPRLERLFVEAAASALAHERSTAIARYEVLRAEIPADLEVGWRLVEQLVLGGRSTDALRHIEQLRRDRVPRIADARLDQLEGDARNALGDSERALVAMRRSAATADELGARQFRARARYKECRTLDTLHRYDEARTACEEAKRTAADAGNRQLRAYAVNELANLDFQNGNLAGARRGYEEVLPAFRELGDRTGESMVLNNLGNIMSSNMDRAGAAKLLEASLAITDAYQDAMSGAPTRENLSDLYHDDLDWVRSVGYAEDAQRVWRTTDEPNELIDATCRLGSLYLDMGRGRDTDRQLGELDALVARLAAVPPPNLTCDIFRAELEAGRGNTDRALALLRGTLERLKAAHEEPGRVDVSYLIAALLADSGERIQARDALVQLAAKPGEKSEEAVMRAAAMLLRRLELEAGAAERAAARFKTLETELRAQPLKRALLTGGIELERLRFRMGDRPGALRKLDGIASSAMAAGAVSIALEAQLRAAELHAELGVAPARAQVIEYGRRARIAGRPGWADRMERLLERGAHAPKH